MSLLKLPAVVELLSFKNNQIRPQMGVLIQQDRNQCWSILSDGHLMNHTMSSVRFALSSTDQILKDLDPSPYEPAGLSLKTRKKFEDIPLILGAIKELNRNSLKKEFINALPLNLSRSRYSIDDLTREFQKIKSDNYTNSKWATYNAVLHATNLFRIYNDPFMGMKIEIFSKEEVDFFSQITQRPEQITRFLERVAAGCNNSWLEFDQKLIQVLKKGAMASKIYPDINKTIALDVLRKAGQYAPKDSDVVVFLKDSGLIAPWEAFPGRYTNLKRISDVNLLEEEEVTNKFQESYAANLIKDFDTQSLGTSCTSKTSTETIRQKYSWLNPVLLPKGEINDLSVKDGCENLRKDFGDMPVYIIDGNVAHEIDDGISIERRSDGIWLHVHIADPTAYLSVNHPLSIFAQLRHTTIYFPDHHVPLIPCNLTDKVLNLGASPFAITFSAKFHANGDIMDYKVQPSIIKNIQHISYTDTDRILKGVDKNAVSSKDLKDIKDLMDKHLEYRSSQGAFSTEFVGEIMLDPYPFKDPAKTWISQPINYPRIQLKLEDDSTAKIFVAECMIVAGRVGARFMTEYKIPTLYRGQEAPNLSTEELQDFETMLSKKDPKTAELPTVESRNIVPYLLKATMNTKPGIHFAMGLDKTGYVKLSSPLRRYTDLMIHWNLKAFWTKTRYPFSESDISSMIPRKTIIEKEIRQLCKLVDRHWLFEWIRRRQVLSNYPDLMKENAFVPHECELGIPRSWKWSRESNTSPEEQTLYDAFILRIDHDKKYFKVVVPIFFNYTTRCYYRVLSEEMFVGNKIKVRINSVDPGILDLKLDYVIS